MRNATFILVFSLLILVGQAIGQVSQPAAGILDVTEKETKPAGDEGRLSCTVTGVADAGGTVVWSKVARYRIISVNTMMVMANPTGPNGQKKYEISVTDLPDAQQVFTLAVRRLTSMDSGKYECVVNLPGKKTENFPRATSEMVVLPIGGQVSQAAAGILNVTQKETKPAGDEGRLSCTVTGVAATGGTVSWSKVTRYRIISLNRMILTSNPTGPNGQKKYEIFVTDLTDSKQVFTLAVRRLASIDSGKYECVIHLPGKKTENSPRATSEMVVLPIGQVSQPAAGILDVTEKETKPAGDEGRLSCTVTGVAAAGGAVSWSKVTRYRIISVNTMMVMANPTGPNGQKKYEIFVTDLPDAQQVFILAVRRLTSMDSGKYECVVHLPGMKAENFPRATSEMVVL